MTPLVVKLGGSLAESGRLRSALAHLARARRPVVIVPGGGPFADAVREAQGNLGFSDAAAHEMALLAMHQMAAAMIDLAPRLAPANTLIAMQRAWRGRQIPVWLPMSLAANDRLIPRDWSVTSDGLAARLAERLTERLGKAEVALLKSCAVPLGATPETLARQGIVDSVFPVIVRRAQLGWRVLGADEDQTLARMMEEEFAGRWAPVRRVRCPAPTPQSNPLRKDLRPCRASSRPS